MNRRHQRGSIEAVIIICLAAALCCALGIAFYQNFVMKNNAGRVASNTNSSSHSVETKKPTDIANAEKSTASNGYTLYRGSSVSTEYPSSWQVGKPYDFSYDMDGVVFTSGDYSESKQAGPPIQTAGARIFVLKRDMAEFSHAGGTLSGEIESMKSAQMVSNVSQATMCGVSGNLAYSYDFTYEGPRYTSTLCQTKGTVFEVRYMYPREMSDSYKSAYEHIVKTIKVN